ncbi:synaptogenesis protein syg-2-like isoform X2 [Mercenaria mercenaria]|uniref:synaptogenesis protein syg-2-like isoform X2 n=1 Tax=Mercenaria mercenaria TaxID=6596 RepID=UPI00234EFA21|nr:synaptogenesis protein syg-2-like isoform X2 [Mercenaria mercenaria]
MEAKLLWKWMFVIVNFGICIILKVVTTQETELNLALSPSIVAENSPQTLTCMYSGSQSVSDIVWTVNSVTVGFFTLTGGSCQDLYRPNATLYNHTCDVSIKTFTLTIKHVKRNNLNDEWNCAVKVPDVSTTFIRSNIVKPRVTVFISSVSLTLPLTSTLTINENTLQQFRCVTSGGLPEPTVKWYNDSRTPSATSDDIEITSAIKTSYSNTSDYLIKTTSTLTFVPSKFDNGISIYCTAYSSSDQTSLVSTQKPNLDVLYGPDGPPEILGFTDNLSYRVIENTAGQLTCLVSGGNPLAKLIWNCYNEGKSDITLTDEVSKTATWIAKRGQDRTCSCYSSHFAVNGSVSIQIHILYPPTTPVFYIKSTEVSGTIKVIKNNSVSVTCSSTGNPNQIQYTWTHNTLTTSGSVMNINRVQSDGQYTCDVQNSMDPSTDSTVAGRNSSSIDIKVLYPPVIADLQNRSIAEGASLTIICPVTVGNPPETIFIWRAAEGREWRTQDLAINNVSRNDSMFYTCEVANIMKQTGQTQTSTTPDSKRFYLNVLYGATVTDFYVSNYAGETSVTVNEGAAVSLHCDVDSNPGSVITLQFQTDGNELLRVVDTKSLECILIAATCIDAGIYVCLASNQHNYKQSVKQLHLYVKCLPRPSPFIQLKENITVAQHQEAVITFTTVAYPEPTKKDFKWSKWNNLQWMSLINDAEYQIDSEGLQSNLTVRDVDETSYGKYNLIVTNTIGNHVWIFNLLPEDKPANPTGFKTLQKIVTETTFTVQWKPGFENGPQQVFILKYKKSSDIGWKSVLVSDTGEAQIIYTVTGLSKGTEYQVAIYASNKWGNSSESEILLLKTKGQPSSSSVADNTGNTSTYANLAYTPNTSETKQNSHTLEDAPIMGVADYTTLEEQLRDDRSTYNVISAVS